MDMTRTIYRITDYTEHWENGECHKSVNNISINEIPQVIALAWYYYENSDVIEEFDLDDLQNAIAFIERVDKVEALTVTIEEVYSPSFDITTIYEYTEDSEGNSLRMEVKGFYHGKPEMEATETFYGSTYWDASDYK